MKQTIAYFSGVDERYGPLAGDASAAHTALNASTDYGRLASAPGAMLEIEQPAPCEKPTALYVFSDRIGGETGHYVIVGAEDGVYAHKNGAWRCIFENAGGGDWGFLSYQRDDDTLLIFGNGIDPVQAWNGETLASEALAGAPAKGRFFALHYERVWMCGDAQNPDRLYYSRAMDIDNWTADVEIPDRGGGFVELPTFDGGELTGIYKVGTDLCVLKSTTALLLYGASPASYQVVEMSGNLGTIAGRTAAVNGQSGYFITSHGIGVQSGTTLSLLDDRKLPRLFDPGYCMDCDPCKEGLGLAFGKSARGIAHNERLYFMLPVGEERENSLLLEYDLSRQTYMVHTGHTFIAMAKSGVMREQLLILNAKGQVFRWGVTPERSAAQALWVTPWLDFGTNRTKVIRGVALYGRVFSQDRSAGVQLTLESDKGQKTRILSPRRGGQELYNFVLRLTGRRFRVRIESIENTGFSFTGGLELEVV